MATKNQEMVAQRVAAKAIKGQKVSISQEMRGIYSESKTKQPSRLTKSKAWPELMEKYLPEKTLTKLHEKFLNKKEVVITGIGKGESEWSYTGQPHSDALKALEQAYKLRGRYPKEDEGGNKTLVLVITEDTAKRYGVVSTSKPETSSE